MTKLGEVILRGATGSRPAAGTEGVLFYDTTLNKMQRDTGAAWEDVDPTDFIAETLIDAKGDLIVGSADDTAARLAVGTDSYVLTADSGEATGVKWAAGSVGAILESLIDAKGDLIVGTADDTAARLAVGTDTHVLTADSGEAGGIKWAASGAAGGDSTYTDTFANEPAASNDGDLFLPSDGYYIERDTGAAWVPWGPIFPLTAPVSGDFSWVNQGSASIVTTYGGVYLLSPALAGDSVKMRVKTAPSTPYTITALISLHGHDVDFNGGGLLFRESSSGKLHIFGGIYNLAVYAGRGIASAKFTDSTTYSAGYTGIKTCPRTVWLRIADNGTSRICSWSLDGNNWHALHTVGRTDFLTADQVGFFSHPINATYPCGTMLYSWEEG